MVVIDKILKDGGWSTKRLIAITGTLAIVVYTFITNDAVPITTITLTAIGGNVANNYINKINPNEKTDNTIKTEN